MSEAMGLAEYRSAMAAGVDLYQQVETGEDAAPNTEEHVEIEVEPEGLDDDTPPEELEGASEDDVDEGDEDPEPIPKEQKNAFYKRVQRERKKAQEEAEAKIRAEMEQQINPYKQFFDKLGVSPDEALRAIEQNNLRQSVQQSVNQEAQSLQYQYGWDDEQTRQYVDQQTQIRIQQQQQQQELHDLRIQVQLNDLAENPDYPGAKQMKSQISEFIRANPAASVQQAYWAVGGSSLAQQLKREAEQREIAKRGKTQRTVVKDAPASLDGPAPLSPEEVAFARQQGMSESEVRKLREVPNNLQEFRKWNKGRK
ncbi:hypothetical protein [Cohnella nanjingensis]|uniref:Uncharacterized protein n=1 Tax=Cohnella nanjingensis TaxID=1387779 RepID=A0A7X0RSB2_9BACL|nr:hypothetical protein [Cohnella nanjingensis]MBB6672621.1 hypothetical protein [Cohnella nanjingensis]